MCIFLAVCLAYPSFYRNPKPSWLARLLFVSLLLMSLTPHMSSQYLLSRINRWNASSLCSIKVSCALMHSKLRQICPGKPTSTVSFGNFYANDLHHQWIPGFKSNLLQGSLVGRKLGNLAKTFLDSIVDFELRLSRRITSTDVPPLILINSISLVVSWHNFEVGKNIKCNGAAKRHCWLFWWGKSIQLNCLKMCSSFSYNLRRS